MARSKSFAFRRMDGNAMKYGERFFPCGVVQYDCLREVEQEKQEDVIEEQEAEMTPEELEKREQRKDRYKPSA